MPTTSNFGWTTPADTDLVKDGAAAIRTLGNNIDASLVDLKGGTTGQVLAKASNTDLDFTWSSVDPLTILDAKGDLISATAADTPARLAVGTNGQVLTADSSTSTGLKWATPASGGKVLQVVTATTTTATTISSTTFTDTGLSASITPSATNSKILIMTSQNVEMNRQTNEAGVGVRIMRDSTAIAEYPDYKAFAMYTGNGTHIIGNTIVTLTWLDSPSTTSSITYKTQGDIGNTANNGTSTWQSSSTPGSIILLEIGA